MVESVKWLIQGRFYTHMHFKMYSIQIYNISMYPNGSKWNMPGKSWKCIRLDVDMNRPEISSGK